jgi:hypothetical protein
MKKKRKGKRKIKESSTEKEGGRIKWKRSMAKKRVSGMRIMGGEKMGKGNKKM